MLKNFIKNYIHGISGLTISHDLRLILSSERAVINIIMQRAMIEVAEPAASPNVGVIHSIFFTRRKYFRSLSIFY